MTLLGAVNRLPAPQPRANAGEGTVVADDDGTMDAELDFDYSDGNRDDLAIKYLTLPYVPDYSQASVLIFARSSECDPGDTGNNVELLVNDQTATTYNPCLIWGSTSSWATIGIPISMLQSYKENKVELREFSGDWRDRNEFLGIDTSRDHGNSVIQHNGQPVYGELMLRIALSSTAGSQPPSACFTVSPPSGYTSTTFGVDGSCSSDDVTPLGALSFRYDFDNDGYFEASYSTQWTAIHQYATGGTKTVHMQVMDSGGAVSDAYRTIDVGDVDPTTPYACLTLQPPGALTGETVTGDASCSRSADGQGLSFAWDWLGNGQFTDGGSSSTHVYSLAAALCVTLMAGCGAPRNDQSGHDRLDPASMDVPHWTVGTQWNFRAEDNQSRIDIVTEEETFNGALAYVVDSTRHPADADGSTHYKYWYEKSKLRFLGLQTGSVKIVLNCGGGSFFPFQHQEYVCNSVVNGHRRPQSQHTYDILGVVQEDVPAGSFTAVAFQVLENGDPVETSAYSPEVGYYVRQSDDGQHVFKLESWKKGQD